MIVSTDINLTFLRSNIISILLPFFFIVFIILLKYTKTSNVFSVILKSIGASLITEIPLNLLFLFLI